MSKTSVPTDFDQLILKNQIKQINDAMKVLNSVCEKYVHSAKDEASYSSESDFSKAVKSIEKLNLIYVLQDQLRARLNLLQK
jgi:hypothetical protein